MLPSWRRERRREEEWALRASTISPSQLAIRIKILYYCLVGGERGGERRRVCSYARASSNTFS
jgi:hypothetical protein